MDVLVDVTGYWNLAAGGIDGATFNPLTGVRLADTRPGINTGACPTVGSYTTIAAAGNADLASLRPTTYPRHRRRHRGGERHRDQPCRVGSVTVYPMTALNATSNPSYIAGQSRDVQSIR